MLTDLIYRDLVNGQGHSKSDRYVTAGNRKDTDISVRDLDKAEELWIKEAQCQIIYKLEERKFVKSNEVVNEKGIIAVGVRTERWMAATWNRQKFILLQKDHLVTGLIMWHEHVKSGHSGVSDTIAKVRSTYWVMGINRSVRSMVNKSVHCCIRFKRLAQQIMSPLPIKRIKPSPLFYNMVVDYFGLFIICGAVQKRVRGKVYGVLITFMSSRAIHLDIAQNYTTDGFLQLL